ncbi:DUF5325 family protein [Paenibacillus tarimensis]|uniref:DUF5325 family protein n=1 Tax=Paenibacillus tarimensis TaxID=416012 RepID=UPI001F46DC53|nr:DUF5325 family protein [Paenibacillus tarimensis]MCF2943746.1 DUF5325 family protein [Paenibacillus tarimensis]
MSKSASLLFACISVLFMFATAIMISHNGWLALLFFLLTMGVIGYGFVYKARQRRRKDG